MRPLRMASSMLAVSEAGQSISNKYGRSSRRCHRGKLTAACGPQQRLWKNLGHGAMLDKYYFDPKPKIAMFPKGIVCENFYQPCLEWPSRWWDSFAAALHSRMSNPAFISMCNMMVGITRLCGLVHQRFPLHHNGLHTCVLTASGRSTRTPGTG